MTGILGNGPTSFMGDLRSLTVQSTIEGELVAAVLTMKDAVFCSNMTVELGFEEGLGSVPLYIDNTPALQVAANRTYSPRATYIARVLFGAAVERSGQDHHSLREHTR